jgi:Cof subfamily protein (haloacid dehalogenase superfamily)
MNIKMLALDLDGTVLSHDEVITPEVKQAIANAKATGIKIAIATGRNFSLMKEYLLELDLTDCYHVVCNGAAIMKYDGTCLEKHLIDDALAHSVAQKLVDLNIPFAMFDEMNSYCEAKNHHLEIYDHCTIVPNWHNMGNACKFVAGPANVDIIHEALDHLPLSLAYSLFQGVAYSEIWPANLHKGTAIETIAKLYGIDISEVLAIGDSGNDIAMLKYVGFGIAMGDASDAVKQAANAVTASQADNGVAVAINQFVLKK